MINAFHHEWFKVLAWTSALETTEKNHKFRPAAQLQNDSKVLSHTESDNSAGRPRVVRYSEQGKVRFTEKRKKLITKLKGEDLTHCVLSKP